MSDLATATFLSHMADHDLVVDITIISIDGYSYAVNLSCSDRGTICGEGPTLNQAVADAHSKFEEKLSEMRNLI